MYKKSTVDIIIKISKLNTIWLLKKECGRRNYKDIKIKYNITLIKNNITEIQIISTDCVVLKLSSALKCYLNTDVKLEQYLNN